MFGAQLRKPVKMIFTKKTKTMESEKDSCDVNRIMNHYLRYGVVPDGVTVKTPKFGDFSNIPTFQDAQNMMRQAEDVFLRVPIEIRRACDHNAAKVMDFLNDPNNKDVLKKYGMLKPEPVEKPDYLKQIAENTKKEATASVAQ